MNTALELRWEVAGEVQLARRLQHLALAVTNFRKPLARLARDVIYPEIRHQFDSEGDPDWADYQSDAYRRWKERTHEGAPKMVLTGALRKSLVSRQGDQAIYRLSQEELVVGTGLTTPDGKWNLGLIHQLGTRDGRIPARPLMRLRSAAQTRAVVIFSDWLYQEGRRAEVGL